MPKCHLTRTKAAHEQEQLLLHSKPYKQCSHDDENINGISLICNLKTHERTPSRHTLFVEEFQCSSVETRKPNREKFPKSKSQPTS